jgi:hypothetical protein
VVTSVIHDALTSSVMHTMLSVTISYMATQRELCFARKHWSRSQFSFASITDWQVPTQGAEIWKTLSTSVRHGRLRDKGRRVVSMLFQGKNADKDGGLGVRSRLSGTSTWVPCHVQVVAVPSSLRTL